METPIVNEEPVIEAPKPAEEVTEAGAKTDSTLLLKSLQEERDKRRDAERLAAEKEAELQRLKDASGTAEVFSEEGLALKRQIDALKGQLQTTELEKQLGTVQTTYPVLKDKANEFEQYRLENPGMKIETAAKAFLAENDLLSLPKPRQGLERDTGGGRTPPKTGMTSEEIDDLRVNNYREYSKRLRNGTLNG